MAMFRIVLCALGLAGLLVACGGESDDVPNPPAVPERMWLAPQLLETDNSSNADQPLVVVDGAGNAMAVWTQSDGTRYNIWAARYLQGSGWLQPQLLDVDDAGDASGPHLAVDGAGNAMAVWHQFDGVRTNVWARRFLIDGGWQAPEIIDSEAGDARSARVGMDSAGNAFVVWQQEDGTRDDIWLGRYLVGAGWQPPQLLENVDLGDAMEPSVTVDGSGNAWVGWVQSDAPFYYVWTRRYVQGQGWQVAQVISAEGLEGDATEVSIAFGPGGTAFAVWAHAGGSGYDIWSNRFTGTQWQGPMQIESEPGVAMSPRIAVDGTGNPIAVWSQSDGGYDIWAARRDGASGWQAPVRIESDDVDDAHSPSIAIDGNGDVVVAWAQSDGTRTNIWSNRYRAGQGWQTAVLLESDNSGLAQAPHVAADAVGNTVVVWSQSDGTVRNIWSAWFR